MVDIQGSGDAMFKWKVEVLLSLLMVTVQLRFEISL